MAWAGSLPAARHYKKLTGPVCCQHDSAEDCRGEITLRAHHDLVVTPPPDAPEPQHRRTGLINGRHHSITGPSTADGKPQVALAGKLYAPVTAPITVTSDDP